MDYKKFVKRRRILFGTLSTNKTAIKMLEGLNPSTIGRYGTQLYEQAYNYYMVTRKKYYGYKVLVALLVVASLINILLFPRYLFLSTIVSTLVAYGIRGSYRCD